MAEGGAEVDGVLRSSLGPEVSKTWRSVAAGDSGASTSSQICSEGESESGSEIGINGGADAFGASGLHRGGTECRKFRAEGANEFVSRGLESLPFSARESASSFPRMPTCEGILTQVTSPTCDSSSAKSAFHKSMLRGPCEPTQLLRAHCHVPSLLLREKPELSLCRLQSSRRERI